MAWEFRLNENGEDFVAKDGPFGFLGGLRHSTVAGTYLKAAFVLMTTIRGGVRERLPGRSRLQMSGVQNKKEAHYEKCASFGYLFPLTFFQYCHLTEGL